MEYKMEETCYEMNLPRENIHLLLCTQHHELPLSLAYG